MMWNEWKGVRVESGGAKGGAIYVNLAKVSNNQEVFSIFSANKDLVLLTKKRPSYVNFAKVSKNQRVFLITHKTSHHFFSSFEPAWRH